ncbi:ribosomal protein S18 acetylase RimI-like enzyme [Herbihabitans rhizosphaerae]|uniref:Ribosomal protein S18 acetylase RimI-like enzyme n=1 Tax=Herbihabitans rhizosphaerae TaxID=1872711 RepID=A0A4Q7KDM9_9PSEU|nr:GNAT family N-acetyltransferase [Herbihabitans rhizosphaerae]RZS31344.1 ribosomal protein S18 acetylase RimI-like enzyme [Herbihabitans rhizosphaerae]
MLRVDALLLVREATVDDADRVSDVHAEAMRVAYRDLFEPWFLEKLVAERRALWPRLMASEEFEPSSVLIAERGDRLAGFIHFGPYAGKNGDGEIYTCYTHPELWRIGVGSTLVNNAWEILVEDGYPKVRLWTLAGANRSRRFYTSKGFVATGQTRERDFGDGRPVLQVEYLRTCRP